MGKERKSHFHGDNDDNESEELDNQDEEKINEENNEADNEPTTTTRAGRTGRPPSRFPDYDFSQYMRNQSTTPKSKGEMLC